MPRPGFAGPWMLSIAALAASLSLAGCTGSTQTLRQARTRTPPSITKPETADLQDLSDEFVANEPRLRAAAVRLGEDLGQLTDAAAMITVASAAMDTITDIISLLA